MNARDVLRDRVECEAVWVDVEQCDDFNQTPIGMAAYMQNSDEYDGNVFVYEVRTALDEHELWTVSERRCSVAVKRDIQNGTRY